MAKENIFRVQDYRGALVALGEREWKTKIISRAPIGHPEVTDYLEEIRQTIAEPDVVFESTRRRESISL